MEVTHSSIATVEATPKQKEYQMLTSSFRYYSLLLFCFVVKVADKRGQVADAECQTKQNHKNEPVEKSGSQNDLMNGLSEG